MSNEPEQLEIDLGDCAVDTLKSFRYQLNNVGDLGTTAQSIDTIDWSNAITLPSSYSSTVSSISWSQDYTISGNGYANANVIINDKGMEIKNGGDIKVGGKSLTEAIEKIEERLAILKPNPELEEKWESLKVLRKQYEELEKEILQKEKMWKILNEK